MMPGHCWSLQVTAGRCWSLHVAAGHCMSLQVAVGHCMSLLITAGQCWPLKVTCARLPTDSHHSSALVLSITLASVRRISLLPTLFNPVSHTVSALPACVDAPQATYRRVACIDPNCLEAQFSQMIGSSLCTSCASDFRVLSPTSAFRYLDLETSASC